MKNDAINKWKFQKIEFSGTFINYWIWGVWTWSFSLCLLYAYSDVFLCSASIVHMSVISLDRYLGISKPLKTRNKSRKIVTAKIAFVWLMTTVISSPLAVLALLDHTNILQVEIYWNLVTESLKYFNF